MEGELVETLSQMGFSRDKAYVALQKNGFDLGAAMDYLLAEDAADAAEAQEREERNKVRDALNLASKVVEQVHHRRERGAYFDRDLERAQELR
jgi:hypothetical protein